MKRYNAIYRCTLFNCSESRLKWQCCNFCHKRNECTSKCANCYTQCNRFFIAKQYYNSWTYKQRNGVI
nr:MAG TPA: hypothetical protein [Caudoviricetes sp.]